MILAYTLSLVGVALAGWCAGMLTFKRATHWCRWHGVTLKCPECAAGHPPVLRTR